MSYKPPKKCTKTITEGELSLAARQIEMEELLNLTLKVNALELELAITDPREEPKKWLEIQAAHVVVKSVLERKNNRISNLYFNN